MRTQLLNKKTIRYEYMDELAEWDEYEYMCPCGKGKIVETYDELPVITVHCRLCCNGKDQFGDAVLQTGTHDVSTGIYTSEGNDGKLDYLLFRELFLSNL